MGFLNNVEKLAKELLNKTFNIKDVYGNMHAINISDLGYTFKFDNAKRRFGCCDYGKKIISLSKHLCLANQNQLNGKIKDTILHEIAHAISVHIYGIKFGKGHGYNWQQIAKQIGSNGKRCFSVNDFGGINRPQSKYTLICPTCNKETDMHRKPKRNYSCGLCSGGKFNPKYKLVLRQNY